MNNNKINIILILTLLLILNLYGQTNTKVIKAGSFELSVSTLDSVIFDNSVIPEFPGGMDSLYSFALKHLHYPKAAIKDSIQGEVIVEFTVDKYGRVKDDTIVKSLRFDVDSICLSMIKQMPRWNVNQAGVLDGPPMNIRISWPIRFDLTKKENN